MVKRYEYQNRNTNVQSSAPVQGVKAPHEQIVRRENVQQQNKSFNRGNPVRQNYSGQHSPPRFSNKIRTDETIDDIKEDISRIEKEIELELKEIKSMKLGM